MRLLLLLTVFLGLASAAEPPLRVLHVGDYPPFEFLDAEGRPQGALIELYRRWSERTGRPVEFICLPFTAEMDALAAGRADVLTGMITTPERRMRFAFGQPIVDTACHIVGDRRLPRIETLAELAGQRIGVVSGEITVGLAAEAGAIPVEFPEYEALVHALVDGRIERIVTETEVVWHHLTRLGRIGDFVAAQHPIYAEVLRPTVRRDDWATLEQIDRGFALIPPEERLEILRRWLPGLRAHQAAFPWVPVLLWCGGGIAVALLVIAGFALVNRTLRRRVAAALTDLKATEDRLRQAQKMDALGQLAGGIAHDFNNLLAGIIGYSELIGRTTSIDRAHEHSRAITVAGERAAALTRHLLAFARPGGGERSPTDLHRIAEETVDLARRTIDPRIAIHTRRTTPVATALADPGMAQNALLNLLLNARDAMAGGGTLTVACGEQQLDAREAAALGAGLEAGRYAVLAVSDTGHGIPPELLTRIFDPFFTTKAPGEGTGLGLAAVYGTMRDHGGMVTVESVPGAGSTFRLLFPATAPAAPRQASEIRPSMGRGRLLLVDDERSVRNAGAEALRQAGWEVDTASDGEEALARLVRGHGYRLAILDLVMPRLHGDEVVRRMRASGDRTPVLVCSGFAPAERRAALDELGVSSVLAKPYRFTDLARLAAETATPL